MRDRTRRWPRRLVGIIVGLAVATLLAEGLVLVLAGAQPRFPRHVVRAPWGLRYNEPNARYRHRSADIDVGFAIDAQGMRADCDYPYEKPKDLQRIVCLGDSFTIGYEVEERDCFCRVLERELRQTGLRVESLNAGVSGFSSAEECLYLERELYRYQPDLVLVSFFENDLTDNVRSGLFALRDDVLVQTAEEYVPAGRMGDLLNKNPLLNCLSERSNAFAYVKEHLTALLKREIVRENRTVALGLEPAEGGGGMDAAANERRLAAAIFERMYAWTRARGIPFVIQSIAFPDEQPPHLLHDRFPAEGFDVHRPGIWYFASKAVLDPWNGKELLYWRNSHSHWTPLAHRLAGTGLADLIVRQGLLR